MPPSPRPPPERLGPDLKADETPLLLRRIPPPDPLPERTFSMAGTDAKTSFIYLQKKRHSADKQGPIFFALAEHVGYMKRGKNELPDPEGNDLVPIADDYISGPQEVI